MCSNRFFPTKWDKAIYTGLRLKKKATLPDMVSNDQLNPNSCGIKFPAALAWDFPP